MTEKTIYLPITLSFSTLTESEGVTSTVTMTVLANDSPNGVYLEMVNEKFCKLVEHIFSNNSSSENT